LGTSCSSTSYVPGDADLDGGVNSEDLNALALNWLYHERVWSEGDFNGDTVVDAADLNAIALNWRSKLPRATAQAVPETSGLMILSLALISAPLWRARRSDNRIPL
jgi:hypothetical protein